MHGCRSPRDGGCAGGRVRVASESRPIRRRDAQPCTDPPPARESEIVGDIRIVAGSAGRGALSADRHARRRRRLAGQSKGRVLSLAALACKAAAVSACCLAERPRLLPLVGRQRLLPLGAERLLPLIGGPQSRGFAKRSWGAAGCQSSAKVASALPICARCHSPVGKGIELDAVGRQF